MQTTTARELYDQMLKLYPDWGQSRCALEFNQCHKSLIRSAGALTRRKTS
jgi:hypothetical protein